MTRRFEFLDPLRVLIQREEKTCKGCTHIVKIHAFGEIYFKCKFRQKQYGNRCEAYVEKEGKKKP